MWKITPGNKLNSDILVLLIECFYFRLHLLYVELKLNPQTRLKREGERREEEEYLIELTAKPIGTL